MEELEKKIIDLEYRVKRLENKNKNHKIKNIVLIIISIIVFVFSIYSFSKIYVTIIEMMKMV